MEVLAVVGAVVVVLPVLLRAVKAVLLAIPGNNGEETIEKIAVVVEKIAGFLSGFKKK